MPLWFDSPLNVAKETDPQEGWGQWKEGRSGGFGGGGGSTTGGGGSH